MLVLIPQVSHSMGWTINFPARAHERPEAPKMLSMSGNRRFDTPSKQHRRPKATKQSDLLAFGFWLGRWPWRKRKKRREKLAAPEGVPRQSPTPVLTRPCAA